MLERWRQEDWKLKHILTPQHRAFAGSLANLGNPNSNKGEGRRGRGKGRERGKKGEERKGGGEKRVMVQVQKDARERETESGEIWGACQG